MIYFFLNFMVTFCDECFCVDATCRAKGNHDVGLGLEKRESNPKFNRGPKVWPKG